MFTLVVGAMREAWCDRCLVTHEFMSVYDHDDPTGPPAGEWGNHRGNVPD